MAFFVGVAVGSFVTAVSCAILLFLELGQLTERVNRLEKSKQQTTREFLDELRSGKDLYV